MAKRRLAICIGDREYQNRFTNCVMNHYQNQFELHVFTERDTFLEQEFELYEGIILSDDLQMLGTLAVHAQIPIFYLTDAEALGRVEQKEGVIWVDKYQEVNRIMDEVLSVIGDEIHQVQMEGTIGAKMRITAVYSLGEDAYQLPFAVTLGSILSERKKVLLIDLQENSGLTRLVTEKKDQGLEELLVMAEGGKCQRNRLMACIGKLDHIDYVYPVSNTECLTETEAGVYLKLLTMLTQELDYNECILNLGVRFSGFFELLARCHQVYLLGRQDGLGQWREYEFTEEMKRRGYEKLAEQISRVQSPKPVDSNLTCDRVVEEWKWNEYGDYVRRMIMQEANLGRGM